MATEQFEVDARLELNATTVVRSLNQISGQLQTLTGRIGNTNNLFGGLVTKALAFGGAYLGIRAVASGMRNFASATFDANVSAEGMQTSLAAVAASVEQISFAEAQEGAASLFEELNNIAVQSPATGSELFAIFQGVFGPIRSAGVAIEDILTLTQNTASAATALGVDFAQAQRDISMMARGLAGTDVKTFSLLQSMGVLTETTKEWNELAPDKRAKRLLEAMGKMGGEAAAAYAKTWVGLSSTFRGVMQQFQRVFSAAIFERIKGVLDSINQVLLENRRQIEAVLELMGSRVASVFTAAADRASMFFDHMVTNIDDVAARLDAMWARFQELRPLILGAAKAAAALQIASFSLGLIGPMIAKVFSAVGFFQTLITGIGAIGLKATLASVGAAIGAFAAPIAIATVAITALIAGALMFRDAIGSMLGSLFETFSSIGSQLMTIFANLWAVLQPPLAVLGGVVLIAVITAFRILAFVIDTVVLPVLRGITTVIRFFAEAVYGAIAALKSFLFDDEEAPDLRRDVREGTREGQQQEGPISSLLQEIRDIWNRAGIGGPEGPSPGLLAFGAPGDRPRVVNDFRGAKIEVRQDFRDADPDRVWIQMRDALEREAVTRTQSGFASAFAR